MNFEKQKLIFALALKLDTTKTWQQIADIVNSLSLFNSVETVSANALRKRVARIADEELDVRDIAIRNDGYFVNEEDEEVVVAWIGQQLSPGTFICACVKDEDEDIKTLYIYGADGEFYLVPAIDGEVDISDWMETDEDNGEDYYEDEDPDADIRHHTPVPFDLQYLITDHVIVIVRDGVPISIDRTHKNFDKIIAAIKAEDKVKAIELIDVKSTIEKIIKGNIVVDEEGKTFVRGVEMHNKLAQKVHALLMEGDVDAINTLVNFQDLLMSNPSFKILERLYEFISFADIEIDPEGYVLAYKVVNPQYLDLHSRTFDNSPGKTLEIERNMVDDNMEEKCSYGLHVCAVNYLRSFGNARNGGGDRVVKVRVSPADFVAIPPDYNFQKARVCKYEVLEDVTDYVTGKYLY